MSQGRDSVVMTPHQALRPIEMFPPPESDYDRQGLTLAAAPPLVGQGSVGSGSTTNKDYSTI